jgi:hypothetical protein
MKQDNRGRRAESDVQKDPARASSREGGGVANREHPDQHTTTGTTPNETFVGRIAGEDVGSDEETGAERRARAADEPREVD